MMEAKLEFKDVMKLASKKGGFEILKLLQTSEKKWGEIEKIVPEKHLISERLQEMLKMGLIEVLIKFDSPTGTKYYKLTESGRKITELLKKFEQEYNALS